MPAGLDVAMNISRAELEQLAALARLRLDPAAAQELEQDFTAIFGMIDQMQAADTEGVEPLAHPLELPQRLREDEPEEPARREDLQQPAPAAREGFYLVPRVVE